MDWIQIYLYVISMAKFIHTYIICYIYGNVYTYIHYILYLWQRKSNFSFHFSPFDIEIHRKPSMLKGQIDKNQNFYRKKYK